MHVHGQKFLWLAFATSFLNAMKLQGLCGNQCSTQDLAQSGTSGPGTQFPTGSHFSPSFSQLGTIFLFLHTFFLFTYNFWVFLYTNFGHMFYVQFLCLADVLFFGPPPSSLSTFFQNMINKKDEKQHETQCIIIIGQERMWCAIFFLGPHPPTSLSTFFQNMKDI